MRYLILTYYTQANGKIDEAMTVANKIRRKDWQTANVILDFKEQKVLTARMHDTSIPKDWEVVVRARIADTKAITPILEVITEVCGNLFQGKLKEDFIKGTRRYLQSRFFTNYPKCFRKFGLYRH
jgi:hypothetical protein